MAQNTIIGDEAITPAIMNERTWGWDTSFPSTWAVNGFFMRTDTNVLYQNTGTEGTPVWTQRAGLTAHEHGSAGDGGVLDADATLVTLGGTDYPLLNLAVL